MCQAFEGEQRYMFSQEKRELQDMYEKHVSGEKVMSSEELRDYNVRVIMYNDAQ